jgi:hypothetical protein
MSMNDLGEHLPHLFTFRPLLYGILMWGIFIYAFRCGGWEERTVIVASVFGAYLSFLLGVVFGVRYAKVAVPVLWVDLIIFILMLGIALRSRKFWPTWVGAFAGVVLLSHLAPLMPGMIPRIYYDATALWSYPKLIAVALGTANHHKNTTRSGSSPG